MAKIGPQPAAVQMRLPTLELSGFLTKLEYQSVLVRSRVRQGGQLVRLVEVVRSLLAGEDGEELPPCDREWTDAERVTNVITTPLSNLSDWPGLSFPDGTTC